MRILLILSITAFISQVFAFKPRPQKPPHSRPQSASPEEPLLGAHQLPQWGPPQQQESLPPQHGSTPQQQGGKPQQQGGSLVQFWGPLQQQWAPPKQPHPALQPAPQPALQPAPYPALQPAPYPALQPAPYPALQPAPQQSIPTSVLKPKPENLCKCISPNVRTTEVSPIVEIDVDIDTVYPCDPRSKIKQISYQIRFQTQNVTCNGIIVENRNMSYDFVYAEATWSSGHPRELITVTDYTKIRMYNNGNLNTLECGTIADGKCAGDMIWGVANDLADDQAGCIKGGNTGNVGNFRLMEIRGKCQSSCSLGRSANQYSKAITNRGILRDNEKYENHS